MRRAAAVALGLVLAVAAPARAERIRDFDVRVTVRPDASFAVEEHIRWDFEGAERHGIYREIPIAYERPGAADFHIRLHVDGVTNAQGVAWTAKTTTAGGYVRIRIGDPDRTVSGVQDYWIRYHVERGILFFDDHDELYWNATGTEWPFPIDHATATVTVPATAASSKIDLACYTGPAGAREQACAGSRTFAEVDFRATRPLRAREGLTVVVGMPKGTVAAPSAVEQGLWRLLDSGVQWLLLPLAAFAGLFAIWRGTGRDPKVGEAIAVRYEPPPGLTPAEIGTVFDESADIDDVTSTIIDLAIRGWLRIEEVEGTSLLFFSRKDYRLTRLKPPGAGLKPHETALLTALFADGEQVLVSDLREKFYRHLSTIRDTLYAGVTKDGLFAHRPDRTRTGWRIAGGALAFSTFLVMPAFGPFAACAVLATGLMILLAGRAMPRRTVKGREAYEQIVGLKEFIARVEADRLERLGGRTATTFEKILPIAIVLGVADRWADAFAGIYTTPPTWYAGSFDGRTFQPHDLVHDVGRSLDTMGRAMSSTPAGSGSSGFGGGGSSGGGFGGGGGGSW
jgi:hypothetical protein